MNTLARDPKGYYAILGLTPGADINAIKTAYRSRVKTVHPDRNASSRAREEFQRLMEAYAVLRDVVRRAEYDTTGQECQSDDDDIAGDDSIPIACGGCGSVTAQPRYVAYHTVRSFLIWAKTGRLEGIFCRVCADRTAVRASIISWLWGWWSPPGLLLTPLALLRNLFGGSKPRRENARILIRQGRAFLARSEIELAHSLAMQAARFARTPDDRGRVEELLDATRGIDASRRLRSRWRLGGGVFLAQALPLVALPVTALVFFLIATRPWDQPVSTSGSIAMRPPAVGEIRHVAIEGLKVRMAPAAGAPVLTLLDRFTTVEVTSETESAEWVRIRTPAGVDGFVETRSLYAGSGARFKTQWCAENRGATPSTGEVLTRRVSGDHRLLVHNEGRRDGVVKLKTLAGNTVTAFYVPATYHIGVGGIPEGTYRIEFATGSHYSRGCGVFLDEMQAMVMPVTLTFKYISPGTARSLTSIAEVSLSPASNDPVQPQPLSSDRFAADD
ncbi:MAG: DnaJ domain-containing protein [Phaeospirillum sp.]|nr:DnaJ domain-containing protein [Phaeospirillum sp.]